LKIPKSRDISSSTETEEKMMKKCSANGRMPVDAVAKKAHGQTQQA